MGEARCGVQDDGIALIRQMSGEEQAQVDGRFQVGGDFLVKAWLDCRVIQLHEIHNPCVVKHYVQIGNVRRDFWV